MTETRHVVQPATLSYSGGKIQTTWFRTIPVLTRHWWWTSLFVLIFVVGIIGGYLISGVPGVIFGLVVEFLDFLIAKKTVTRLSIVEKVIS